MKRRTGADIFGRILIAGISILMLPLAVSAAVTNFPSAETLLFLAANASLRLTLGNFSVTDRPASDIFSAENTDKQEIYEIPENAVPSEIRPFTVDDSEMLSFGSPEIPNSTDEEKIVDDENIDGGPRPYPTSLENHDGKIITMQYGHFNGDNFIDLDIAGQVRNVTDISNEELVAESRLAPNFTIEKNGEPQVLIMHTHTTESYEPYERDFYDASFTSRTTDERMNMVAVGNAIAEQLEAAGISVIHNTEMHDYPSYNGSYDRSRETVRKILDKYPSIKIVLDIHRDAIERENGDRIAPVAKIDGKNAAQVMIICGCDDGTMGMPNYMKNFRFACQLQQSMESKFPGLTRPILFDYRQYNQDMTEGSILIEVGAHGNSIEQAVYSGELIGKALSSVES